MNWLKKRRPEVTPNPQLDALLADLQRSVQAEMDAATDRVEQSVREALRAP